jgi:hypothetical protein
MQQKDRQKDILFLAILAVVHTCFYFMAWHFKTIYDGDSPEYIQEAANIKNHFFFYSSSMALPPKEEYMTLRPPLYPLFIASLYMFAVNNWVLLFFQNILSLINIFLARDTMLRFGYKKKYDWLFLLFAILYPAQFMFANIVYPDILLQTFMLIYFRHFVLMFYDKKWKHTLWMSFALIAGALVKPILYPFAVVHFIILCITAYREKIKLSKVLVVTLLPVSVFILYDVWNYSRTGKFHFSSIEAVNSEYNCMEYQCHTIGIIKSRQLYDETQSYIATIPSFKKRYDTSIQIAKDFIKPRFLSYCWFHLVNSTRVFIDPGKNEVDFFMGWSYLSIRNSLQDVNKGFYARLKNKGWRGIIDYIFVNDDPAMPVLMLILFANCIRLIGFCIFIFNKKIPLPIRSFILSLVLYFSIVVGPVVNTHYFLPVSLIMIGSAVIGFRNLFKQAI